MKNDFFLKLFPTAICRNRLVFISMVLAFLLFCRVALADPKQNLTIGYVEDSIPGVNVTDAKIAVNVLLNKIVAKKRYGYRTEIVFYSNVKKAIQDAEAEKIDVVGIDSIQYVRHRDHIRIMPELVGEGEGDPLVRFVLLSRKDFNIKSIYDLKHKKLIVLAGSNGIVSSLWLDTYLMEKRLPVSSSFFAEVRKVSKGSKAILPVFFGQVEACMVTRSVYDTMKELNPQIGRQLSVLAESPKLLTMITCLGPGLDKITRDLVIDFQLNLDNEPEGKQILTILHTKRILRYRPEYLFNVETLYKKYISLKGEQN